MLHASLSLHVVWIMAAGRIIHGYAELLPNIGTIVLLHAF